MEPTTHIPFTSTLFASGSKGQVPWTELLKAGLSALVKLSTGQQAAERQGWQAPATIRSVTVAGAAVELATANPRRLGIGFAVSPTAEIHIGNSRDAAILASLVLPTSGGMLWFHRKDFGDLPAQAWFGLATALSWSVSVVEVVESAGG